MEPPRPLASPTPAAPALSCLPNAPPSPPLSKIPSSSPPRYIADNSDLSPQKAASPSCSPSPKPKERPVVSGPSSDSRKSQKRRLSEAEDEVVSPPKKAKNMLTSTTVRRKPEVEDLHARRMLELARAARATFAAHVKYQRLRMKELEIHQAMAVDDCEEAEELLKEAELQAGHIKGSIQNGVTFEVVDRTGQCGSNTDSSDGRSSCLPHCKLVSPSPSIETSSDL